MSGLSLGDIFAGWAQREPSIRAVVMIGSRARGQGDAKSADEGSDWDYQLIVSQPDVFANSGWAVSAGLSKSMAYTTRSGRLGRVTKASAIFSEGEIDLVLLPLNQLRLAKLLLNLGVVSRLPSVQLALQELAMVLVPGYQILKGTLGWRQFFQRIIAEITPFRLDDEAICALAEAFVCDCVSVHRKITRGEFLAAQRLLHSQLADTNFRLLHELRQRSNVASFPDARRIELLAQDRWREAVTIDASPDRESLAEALNKSAQTCRELAHALVGVKWKWPDLPLHLRRE